MDIVQFPFLVFGGLTVVVGLVLLRGYLLQLLPGSKTRARGKKSDSWDETVQS